MAVLSTVLLALYIPLASLAHLNLHYAARFSLRVLRRRFDPHTQNRTIDLFFPLLQCTVVLPIVQAVCVWRVHQTRISAESTLLTWFTALLFGGISAVISLLWDKKRTYYAQQSTLVQLMPSTLFLYEGASRNDASGDIAAACMLLICCAIQFVYPHGELSDNIERYARMQGVRNAERRLEQLVADENQSLGEELDEDDDDDDEDYEVESVYENYATLGVPENARQFHAYASTMQSPRKAVSERFKGAARRASRFASRTPNASHTDDAIATHVRDIINDAQNQQPVRKKAQGRRLTPSTFMTTRLDGGDREFGSGVSEGSGTLSVAATAAAPASSSSTQEKDKSRLPPRPAYERPSSSSVTHMGSIDTVVSVEQIPD